MTEANQISIVSVVKCCFASCVMLEISQSVQLWIFLGLLAITSAGGIGAYILGNAEHPRLKKLGTALVIVGLPMTGMQALPGLIESTSTTCEKLGIPCGLAQIGGHKSPVADPAKGLPQFTGARTPAVIAPAVIPAANAVSHAGPARAEASERPARASDSASRPEVAPVAASPKSAPPSMQASAKATTVTTHQHAAQGTAVAVATHVDTKVIVNVVTGGAGPDLKAPPPRLVRGIKSELKRLGCYPGEADTSWTKEARAAVDRFNTYGHRSISDVPEQESLAVLKSFAGQVCP